MSTPGATLEVFESKTPGKPIGTVCICTRDHINAATATCLWTTDLRTWLGPGESINSCVIQGSILTLQRNDALRRAEGDWILFIDDDMVWQPNAVRDLIASWKDLQAQMEVPVILGGLCHRRAAPYDPTLYMREQPTSGGYRFLEKWDTEIVEVDATGLAFLLIPFSAIERWSGVAWPEPGERVHLPPPPVFTWSGMLGEDLQFCQDMKAAGVRIFVDTRIEIGHITEIAVSQRDFLAQIAQRSPIDEAIVRKANERMGLPTLSAEEARRRLGW